MKLTDFTTPTGAKGNILSPSSWWGMILGAFVLLLTFSWAERLGRAVGNKVPALAPNPTNPFAPYPQAPAANPKMYIG